VPGLLAGAWLVLAPGLSQAVEPAPSAAPASPGAEMNHLMAAPPAAASEAPVPESVVPEEHRKEVRLLVNPVAGDAAAVSKGGLLFAANCRVCHGSASEGPPPNSGFTPPPRDFRSRAFHAARTDGELFYAIRHGVDGTAMLPWEGRLTDREIWMLVAYIRTRSGTAP
jgi:mono/diheme cytochrome c family protein